MPMFDRTIFFNSIRDSLFGSMTQPQVDGMNYKLDVWEDHPYSDDLRWLAYPFATAYHETGARMEPVREGFCESDADARAYVKAQGYKYATPDPVTGQVYYGRGDIQTTWADNYKTAGQKIGLGDQLYRDPEKMLDDKISADCLYRGMVEGWYRASDDGRRQTLNRYFNAATDDAYGAREIVNGDKATVPSWSDGLSIGKLIAGYHGKFLDALNAARQSTPAPSPSSQTVTVTISAPPGITVEVVQQEATS